VTSPYTDEVEEYDATEWDKQFEQDHPERFQVIGLSTRPNWEVERRSVR
jgi:hypothetical protein